MDTGGRTEAMSIDNREQLLRLLAQAVNDARIQVSPPGNDVPAKAEIVQPAGLTDGERTKLLVCGQEMQGQVEFWPARGASKMRMNIGDYGEKVHFQQLRDGGFNTAKAAAVLVDKALIRVKRLQEGKRRDEEYQAMMDRAEGMRLEERLKAMGFDLRLWTTSAPGQAEWSLKAKGSGPADRVLVALNTFATAIEAADTGDVLGFTSG